MALLASTALWITAPGRVELRTAPLSAPVPGQILVRTLFTAISRGTERLVFEGRVPASEQGTMACPMQEGSFGFPVKYGYMSVGVVEDGPADLIGRTVFFLSPHQSAGVLPGDFAVPVPDGVPPRRAVLGANMETALNILWDAGIGPGDRVAIIGAGVVGLLAGFLAAAIPGTDVTMVDIDAAKAEICAKLGIAFALHHRIPQDCDIAINTSASAAGLESAIAAAGVEATIVEASWYGDKPVTVPLGGAFHSRRLRIVSSQVGLVAPARRARWTHRRRLAKALDLLRDERLDALISDESPFLNAAEDYPRVLADPATLAHIFTY